MRATLAMLGAWYALNLVTGFSLWLIDSMPEWLGTTIVVGLLVVLPITAFVKVAAFTRRAIMEEGNH